jgi:hypothetical protein
MDLYTQDASDEIRRGHHSVVSGTFEWSDPGTGSTKTKLRERHVGESGTLTLELEGREGRLASYMLTLAFIGGYNQVFAVAAIPDIMIRLCPDADFDEEEVTVGMLLAEHGICPEIYMNLRVKRNREVLRGTAIERLHYTLADIQECPVLMRKMFVEGDGESALVDLYARASQFVTCVDTKPDNVVVRLYDAEEMERRRDAEETKGAYHRRRPRVALIDVDAAHCNYVDAAAVAAATSRAPIGAVGPADLDLFLRGVDIKDVHGVHGLREPMLAATLSLLVHVTVAAVAFCGFGLPYVRIARILLDHWGVVCALVRADTARRDSKHRMATNTTVLRQIAHYCTNPESKAHPHCKWAGLREFLEGAIGSAPSRVLHVCTTGDLIYPGLYEALVTMIHAGSLTHEECDGAEDPASLMRLVKPRASLLTACVRDTCAYHSSQGQRMQYEPRTAPSAMRAKPPVWGGRVHRDDRTALLRGEDEHVSVAREVDGTLLARLVYHAVQAFDTEEVARAAASSALDANWTGADVGRMIDAGELLSNVRGLRVQHGTAEKLVRRLTDAFDDEAALLRFPLTPDRYDVPDAAPRPPKRHPGRSLRARRSPLRRSRRH